MAVWRDDHIATIAFGTSFSDFECLVMRDEQKTSLLQILQETGSREPDQSPGTLPWLVYVASLLLVSWTF